MATVRTGLQLYDGMTGVLGGVVKALNMTVSAMSDMEASMNRGFNPAIVQPIQAQLHQVDAALRQAHEEQERLNSAMDDGTGAASGLLNTVKRLAAAYLTIEGARRLAGATLGGAMEQQKMLDMFIARAGDAQVGAAMFQTFKAQALEAGQDVNRSLQSTLSFFSATQNVDQLTKLNQLATRLAAFDSTGQGIEGAAFALKEAMSGDIISLSERFNMSKADIRALGIDQLGKTGNIEGFLTAFDKLLEKQRMGEEAFERMMSSPAKQMETLSNNLESQMADAGGAAIAALAPLIATLNEAFREDRFEPFLDGLSNGLAVAARMMTGLLNGALWLAEAITRNWSWIEPVIWGLTGAMTGLWLVTQRQAIVQGLLAAKSALSTASLFLQIAATSGLTAAWGTLNRAMQANVFILIATAIASLVLWLIHLWKTNDQFAAALYRAWNGLLGFFDRVPIFFARVGLGIANAIQTMRVNTLEIIDGLINGVIAGINWLIDKLNRIPGVSIQAIQAVSFASNAAGEADAIRQAGEDIIAKMEAGAAARALQREQNLLDFSRSRAAQRAQEETQKQLDLSTGGLNIDSVGEVGEVGRIRDTVDISAEDLRIMRELAEMRSIQNFVSLRPQLTFGDTHIRQDGRTVEEIVANIRDRLSEELASSASAVLEG